MAASLRFVSLCVGDVGGVVNGGTLLRTHLIAVLLPISLGQRRLTVVLQLVHLDVQDGGDVAGLHPHTQRRQAGQVQRSFVVEQEPRDLEAKSHWTILTADIIS